MGKINAEKTAKIGKGASLWRVNGWFHLRCYDRHRTPRAKQQALETRDQERALALAYERFAQWKGGTFDPWRDAAAPARAEEQRRTATPTLEEAAAMYLAHQRREQRAATTMLVTQGRLSHFGRHLAEQYRRAPGALTLHEITPEMVRSFIFRLTTKRSTQRTLYIALAAFFRWAVEHQLLDEAPTDAVSRPKLPKLPAEYLTMNEFQMIVLLVEDRFARLREDRRQAGHVIWFRHLITLAVYTGLRRGELVRLRWGDVRLPTSEEPQGWVTVREAKFDSVGRVPLPPQAVEALRAMHERRTSESEDELVFKGPMSGRRLTATYVTYTFKRYVRLAGFSERLRFHSLRHTYASWLAQHGVRTKTLQELMRHRNLKTTERYMHLSPDHLQQAVSEVFGGRQKRTVNREWQAAARGHYDGSLS